MHKFVAAACLTFATSSSSAAKQQGFPSNSLPRALAAFAAADVDHDGKISSEEARTIPISPEDFVKEGGQGDGTWSRDEFMLFYYRRLVVGGQPVGLDLDAEVARIQALKRVRVVEQVRKQSADPRGNSAGVEPVGTRLEKALGDLEKSAAAKRTTPEDFRRLRNLVILSGRSVSEPLGDSRTPTAQARMLQTLDRMEERAASGQYAKEDFERLRTFTTPSTSANEIAKSGRGEPTRRPTGESTLGRIDSPPASTPASTSLIPNRTGPVQGPADARRRGTDPRGSNGGGQKIEPRQKTQTAPTPAPVERPVLPPDRKSDPNRSRP